MRQKGLAKPAGATIDLKANRDGDTVTITATAEAKPGAAGDAAKLRLRRDALTKARTARRDCRRAPTALFYG